MRAMFNKWFGGWWTHAEVLRRIRLHPLFLALLVVSWFAGLFQETFVLFLVVILHELGHAWMANALGYEVREVSLLPFGGVARLSYGNIGFAPRNEALVAIAGPFVNLVLVLLSALMYAAGLWSLTFYHLVAGLNLWIAVFNLLPALPLDGGRIWRAARSRSLGYERATREGYRVGLWIAATLLLMGVTALWTGHPHFGMIILGMFLFVSAWAGRRDLRMDTIRFLDAKRQQDRQSVQAIRSIASQISAPIRDVVKQFAPDRYHLVYVLSDDGAVAAIVEEDEVLAAVFEGHWLDPIGSLCRP